MLKKEAYTDNWYESSNAMGGVVVQPRLVAFPLVYFTTENRFKASDAQPKLDKTPPLTFRGEQSQYTAQPNSP